MADTKYGKYFVSDPKLVDELSGHSKEAKREGMTPAQVFLDNDLVPGCPVWFDVVWVYDNVLPAPWVLPHKHDVDEVLVCLATNKEHDLGGVVEIAMGDEGEIHTITRSTAIFIPKGLTHCPLTYKSVDKNKPQIFIAMLLNPEYKSTVL